VAVLSLAGGIAAVECVRGFGVAAGLSWPNDVVCDGRKLAGVLAELGPGGCVLLGIGINLSSQARDLPTPDRLAPTSILLETGAAPSASEALNGLLAALRPLAALFDAEGPPAIAARARPLDTLAGSAVELRLASRRLLCLVSGDPRLGPEQRKDRDDGDRAPHHGADAEAAGRRQGPEAPPSSGP